MTDESSDPRPSDAQARLDRAATVPGKGGKPDELGGFRLKAKLSRGGMGEVWKAWDPTAERFVVIKLVPPDVQHVAEEMARVKGTFARVHRLHHQHICPVHGLGHDPQRGYFLVMQYIEGQTLSGYRRSYVARCGSFPLDQVIRVLRPVAEALDYAHAQKVVHRDVKPQNILVSGDADDVQLVDFGLAAEVHTSLSRVSNVRMDTSGTRPYMAPEQWRGEYQDARTDQYALGVVAFELLAGRLPFDTPDFDILRACVLNEPPPGVPDQPEHIDQALARALAKHREERFSSCSELIEALRGVAASQSVAQASPLVQASEDACPTELVNSLGIKLKLIPAGTFEMGSRQSVDELMRMFPDAPAGASEWFAREDPVHRVTLGRPFYLGVHPVTVGQFAAFVEATGHKTEAEMKGGAHTWTGEAWELNADANWRSPGFRQTPEHPVVCVSWNDAVAFCRWLAEQEGHEYRLPAEAEWEYACRAGTSTLWSFGDDASKLQDYAWFSENAGEATHPVGQKKPNPWGLYDMHGNALEWCAEWFDEDYYSVSPSNDPVGPSSGGTRVVRGGSWFFIPGRTRSASRCRCSPVLRFDVTGLRVSRTS